MWQAMLMSAHLPNSKQIFIHGFMTVDGQKISKSLGNTIDPVNEAEKYGTDALRYYLLAKVHPWEDSDFSWTKFKETYNADLANGLGNLVARVAKLCENSGFEFPIFDIKNQKLNKSQVFEYLNEYEFNDALAYIWNSEIKWGIKWLDEDISKRKPWELEGEKLKQILSLYVTNMRLLAYYLQPFMPETAEKILEQFKGPKIKSEKSLFPRI